MPLSGVPLRRSHKVGVLTGFHRRDQRLEILHRGDDVASAWHLVAVECPLLASPVSKTFSASSGKKKSMPDVLRDEIGAADMPPCELLQEPARTQTPRDSVIEYSIHRYEAPWEG